MNANDYRAIMRQQAGAVALICTGAPGARYGLTATAVCSVTDDPPTLLACVNKNASAHDHIFESEEFSVNLLAEKHEEIAGVFAGMTDLKGDDRFKVKGFRWIKHKSGMPRLTGALATLDCEVVEKQQFSTHTIFFGRVREGAYSEGAAPLLYLRGEFGIMQTD
ncbi:MAG: flavin reductase family protein [Pseudomonadota bacterium]